LRIGEIRALDWRRDVDLVAATITVNQQTRRGQTTTPKGRTRRTIPMTETLLTALKALDTIRTGFVARKLDGAAMNDNETRTTATAVSGGGLTGARLAQPPACLRDPRRDVRGEPLEADAVDGAQAHR